MEEETFVCDRCEGEFSLDERNIDVYDYDILCNSCVQDIEDEENNSDESSIEWAKSVTKNTETDAPSDISIEDVCKLVSDRTFGIEFEVISKDGTRDGTKKLASQLNFTCSGDGSVDSFNRYSGIEYQTSVLSGESGAKDVVKFLDKLKENSLVNESCGTHIHLGATGLFDKNNSFSIKKLKDISSRKNIFIEKTLLKNMVEAMGEEDVKSILEFCYYEYRREGFYSSSYRMSDGRVSRYVVVNSCIPSSHLPSGMYQREFPLVIRQSTLDTMQIAETEASMSRILITKEKDRLRGGGGVIDVKDVLLYSSEESTKYNLLKTVLYYYALFDKIFFAMLPESRQDNTYCKPLSNSYSVSDIASCESQLDVEKMWYKKSNIRDINRAKSEHYEDSRYHSLNMHSLFYKYGTLEIRSHHGTMDSKSILLWVALHQRIIDNIESGRMYTIGRGIRRQSYRNFKELFKVFMQVANINEGDILHKFVLHRIEKYSPSLYKLIKQ